MENLIAQIATTPLPTILVMAGILFLFLAVVGRFGANVVVSPQKQRLAGVLGSILLITGMVLYLQRSSAPPPSPQVEQTPSPPADQPSVPPRPDTLKEQIRIIDLQTQKLEEELTKIPTPPSLLFELEGFKQEHEVHLSEIENKLERFNLELEELRPHQSVDSSARESIQKIEDETIPDLKGEKMAVQQQLEQLQEEIKAAQKRMELEKKIHELEVRKQTLREEATP